MNATISKDGKQLTITVNLQQPRPAKTGKSIILYSSGWGEASGANVKGLPVYVALTASLRPGSKAQAPVALSAGIDDAVAALLG